MPGHPRESERFSLAAAFGLYTIAFLALGWPWLSGAVEIPYDAASQFYPQFAFMARSFATGQSPFWTPNIFAGWPQIADPQSLIFSPLHVVVALLVPNPSPRLFDALVFALLYAGGAGVILFFRDRKWHLGGAVVAALAVSFGGSAASDPARRPGRSRSFAAVAVDAGASARTLVLASRRGRRCVCRHVVLGAIGLADRGLCSRALCSGTCCGPTAGAVRRA
jgi:hypothetical protein